MKYFVKGDRRTGIADTLVDGDGDVVSLTGCTVAFRMVLQSDLSVKVDSAAATVDSAAAGTVSYAWGASDTNAAGVYRYWWIVTNTSSGKVEHFPGSQQWARLEIVEDY